MGCAACITDKKITQPIKTDKPINIVILAKVVKTLKPTKMVLQQQFSRLITITNKYCLNYEPKPILNNVNQEESNENLRNFSYENMLVSKWKLIIFCQQYNVYNQKYDRFNQIIQHTCFKQIEKDLDRTFPQHKFFQSPEGITTFKRILKRISTYFPKVGYTQGVNFIVGYLLILGFTQIQSFWFTIHIALHKNYLLLGLFEDGFPLSSIYCKLFHFLLKKNVPKLHKKFQELSLADQIWIFKWFMTYYIYSFPFQIVKQIWDFIIVVGGLGLVYFAVALVSMLEEQLLKFEDDTEIANFFTGLKDLENFNNILNLKQLLNLSYTIKITNEQISSSINQLSNERKQQNFYINYFKVYNNEKQSSILLQKWYQNIEEQRLIFQKKQNQYQDSFTKQQDQTKIQQKKSEKKLEKPQLPPKLPKPYKRKQIKFRVKDQLKKKEENFNIFATNDIQVSQVLSNSKISQKSAKSNKSNISNKQKNTINGKISQTERFNEDSQRYNASVHIDHNHNNKKQISFHHEQGDVQIFDLQQKHCSFKKKKTEQNLVTIKNMKKKPLQKKISKKICNKEVQKKIIKDHSSREILHTIENQNKSVIQFENSQNNIIQNLSSSKSKYLTPEDRFKNQSNRAVSIESSDIDHRHQQSIEIQSVK